MTRRIDFIPRREADFFAWQKPIIPYIQSHANAWNIPSQSGAQGTSPIDALVILRDAYEARYLMATDPATRTAATVIAKNESMSEYQSGIRTFLKSYITYNAAVTDEDRRNMGLPIHKKGRTMMAAPTTVPECKVGIPSPGILEIRFYAPDVYGRKKPDGVHGCELKWIFSDTVVSNWSQLTNAEFITHTPFRLSFDGDQRGRRIWFALRWENTRGVKGPWSEIFDTVVA